MRSSTSCGFEGGVCRLPLIAAMVIIGPLSGVTRGAEKDDLGAAHRLVDEALRAEASGDETRRAALLREAIDLAPDYPPARWHSGQIWADGAWQPIPVAEHLAASDPNAAEYRRLREACGDSPVGQLVLARWCRRKGLSDEARYHWATVLSFQPNNQEALQAIGMRWFRGRLLTHARIRQWKKELKASRSAARRWAPQIARWERMVTGEEAVLREQALEEVRALDKTEAIPAVEELTLSEKRLPKHRTEACQTVSLAFLEALVSIADHAATESLVRHAVLSSYPDVRREAARRLKSRPPHEFVPMLLNELATPIETWFYVTADNGGSVHYSHSLHREGPFADWSVEGTWSVMQHDMRGRFYAISDGNIEVAPARTESDASVHAKTATIASRSIARFGKEAAVVEQQIAKRNQMTVALNQRITDTLTTATGQDLGPEPRSWWDWWQDYNEYYSPEERPVHNRQYYDSRYYYHRPPQRYTSPRRYRPPRRETPSTSPGTTVQQPTRCCFAAGTSVWTRTGQQPIERLRLGDLVLSQDVFTGELAYQPVIGTTVRPPSPITKLSLGAGLLHATLGHPLWVSGSGWKMAKELEEGSYVCSLNGPVPFVHSEPAGESKGYNLIVAGFHTYFVGEDGFLVHDNTPRQPTSATVPGWSPQKPLTNANQR